MSIVIYFYGFKVIMHDVELVNLNEMQGTYFLN